MMSRRLFSKAFVAGAAVSVVASHKVLAAVANAPVRNFVFVHGLYADGSCWSDVIARLQARGLNATAVQNPLTTLAESSAAALRVIARQDGPTVLVGHSFGGTVVTNIGDHPNVAALVYVAGRVHDANEDFVALGKTFATAPAASGVLFDGDEGRLSEDAFLRDFAGDVPTARAKVLFATQQPFQRPLLAERATQAAWRAKPSFYAVSAQDRVINPDFQRFMARRIGAKTIELPASHVSMISRPDDITALILEAAGHRR